MLVNPRQLAKLAGIAVPSFIAATIVVAALETWFGVPNASAVYLVAVVATAIASGTLGGILSAIAAFLLYDFLFVRPLHALAVADAGEWLNLILLLFVGVVVGQLAALQRARAETAKTREREAGSLFRVSRDLATRESTVAVLPAIADALRSDTGMERVWITLGRDEASERTVADTGQGLRPSTSGLYRLLRRMPGNEPAKWVHVHSAGGTPGGGGRGGLHRVRIDAGDQALGSIWTSGPRGGPEPDRTATRLLAAAADQVGQAVAHDQLASDVQAAEIARQGDALKSALLQSVSHDLRTPLATIRAAAGTLRQDRALPAVERLESLDAIDREVEYLNRLVTNLLDLSRIEAGVLRVDRDAFDLEDLLGPALDRARARLRGRSLDVELDAPPVFVDPVLLDQAITNALDNATKYTPSDAAIRIAASTDGTRYVRLTVEDSGEGVSDNALPRLFDKFYRVSGTARPGREGTGIGLAVVRGLVETMGGRVVARRSALGGLAIDIDLERAPIAAVSPEPNRDVTLASRVKRGPTVLVIEDDEETRAAVVRDLVARGFRVVGAADARTGLERWETQRPDVVLLDLGLPDMDGLELVRRIRREAKTPIVILSGRDDERQKVEALERGADDYVTKPFGVEELNARLRLALRHAAGPAADPDGRIVAGPLEFDAAHHRVTVAGAPVDLTPREFEILRVLLTHAGRLVTKGRLLRAVWGEAYSREDSYVYVHVSQLRRKLAAADHAGALRDLIVTEPGVGYRVRDDRPSPTLDDL